MKKIKNVIILCGFLLTFCFTLVPLVPTTVGAVNVFSDACDGSSNAICADTTGKGLNTTIKTIINILLYILGAVAVIVIIIAGVMYVISVGDPNAVNKAKNTLLYAVIGLIVAIIAYAIVNFVIQLFV